MLEERQIPRTPGRLSGPEEAQARAVRALVLL